MYLKAKAKFTKKLLLLKNSYDKMKMLQSSKK